MPIDAQKHVLPGLLQATATMERVRASGCVGRIRRVRVEEDPIKDPERSEVAGPDPEERRSGSVRLGLLHVHSARPT